MRRLHLSGDNLIQLVFVLRQGASLVIFNRRKLLIALRSTLVMEGKQMCISTESFI